MALLQKVSAVQEPLVATFTFDILDTLATTAGVTQAMKTAAGVYEPISLPVNSVVIGGDVVVETVSNDTGTATISVGDSASATRYLGATSIKTAARTALVPTGFLNATSLDLRITLANANGDATTGKVRVTVSYIVIGRSTGVSR